MGNGTIMKGCVHHQLAGAWGSSAQQVRKSPHLELVPHLAPTCPHICKVQRSRIVELPCLCVERAALLDCAEASNLQRLGAFATAWIHGDFLPKADLFLLTTLPC